MTISKPHGKGLALVLTSLLFSLMHGNLAQIPFAFLIGLVLGYLSLKYSLLAAIALHIYNNFILAEVMGFLIDSGSESLGTLSLFLFTSLPAIYAIYYLISNRDKIKAYIRENSATKKSYKLVFTSPGFLAAVLLSVLEIIKTVERL